MNKVVALMIVVVLVIFTFFGTRNSQAAMPPAPFFCERQGYSVIQENTTTYYCDFGDGNKCEIWEFYRGECGQEYNTGNFPCVEEGEPVFHFDKCCEGLEPYLKCGMIGQARCRKIPNIFVKIWEWIICLFGLG